MDESELLHCHNTELYDASIHCSRSIQMTATIDLLTVSDVKLKMSLIQQLGSTRLWSACLNRVLPAKR